MRDWLAAPQPRDLSEAWARLDRFVTNEPEFRPLLTLPNGDPIVIDGATRIPHGVRSRLPASAWIQVVGAIIGGDPSLEAIDDDYLYCNSTSPVRVHILVLL